MLLPTSFLKTFGLLVALSSSSFVLAEGEAERESYVDGLIRIPDVSVPTLDFTPPTTLVSPVMRRYLAEKQSIVWLANKMDIANFELDHLALHRTLTPHKLITRQKESLFVKDPDVLEELEFGLELARDVEKIMKQLRQRFSAAATQVGTATAMFYYEDDEKSRWVNRFAEAAGITTAFTGAARVIGGGIKAVLKLTWMKLQPKPNASDIAENHQLWINQEMDSVVDELYGIFHRFFQQSFSRRITSIFPTNPSTTSFALDGGFLT